MEKYEEYEVNTGKQKALIKKLVSEKQENFEARIDELRQIIDDKKRLDLTCNKEQAELKKLLGY